MSHHDLLPVAPSAGCQAPQRARPVRWLAAAAALALIACGGPDDGLEDGADGVGTGADQQDVTAAPKLWVGAADNKPDNSIDAFLDDAKKFGPWRVHRSFSSSLPDDIKHTYAANDAKHGVISFHSVKPPVLPNAPLLPNGKKRRDVEGVINHKYDDTIASLAASFPTDHTTYLTMFHEPEDDLDGDTFVGMFKRFYQVAKKANPHVKIGTVHMSYYWQPSTPNGKTDKEDSWWVGSEYTDFIGVDDYNDARQDTAKKPRTSAADDPSFQRWFKWAKTKGKPLAVVEFGRFEDPSDHEARGRDLLATEAFLRKNNFFMFLYWNGDDPKTGDWSLTGGYTQTVMKAISSRGRAQ